MPAAPDGAPPLRLRINLAAATVQGVPSPPGAGERDALALPPGEAQLSTQKKHKADLMGKRAMETALAPGKNIFMQGFMMYMSGSCVIQMLMAAWTMPKTTGSATSITCGTKCTWD